MVDIDADVLTLITDVRLLMIKLVGDDRPATPRTIHTNDSHRVVIMFVLIRATDRAEDRRTLVDDSTAVVLSNTVVTENDATSQSKLSQTAANCL